MMAVVHERFVWTRLEKFVDWLGVSETTPAFAAFALSAPAAATFLVFTLVFYLLIVWLDFS